MSRKLIVILAAAMMALTLSACGLLGQESETPSEGEKASQAPDKQVAPEQGSDQTPAENQLGSQENQATVAPSSFAVIPEAAQRGSGTGVREPLAVEHTGFGFSPTRAPE